MFLNLRLDSGSDSELEEQDGNKPKKSIYSDEEDASEFNPPPKKNFEGGIKPGLNKVRQWG